MRRFQHKDERVFCIESFGPNQSNSARGRRFSDELDFSHRPTALRTFVAPWRIPIPERHGQKQVAEKSLGANVPWLVGP